MLNQFQQGPFRLSQEYTTKTLFQVVGSMVGSVGTIDEYGGSYSQGGFEHAIRYVPHASEAHLREEVEVILVNDNDLGIILLKCGLETVLGVGWHGGKHCDRNTCAAQESCRVERTQRRVRLHLPRLFAVEVQVIRMGQ